MSKLNLNIFLRRYSLICRTLESTCILFEGQLYCKTALVQSYHGAAKVEGQKTGEKE